MRHNMIKLTQCKSTSGNPLNKGFAGIAAKLTFIVATTAYATTALAGAPTSDANTAYVDSIHQWGAWELDIEPAAGGLQQLSTQALHVKDTKVSLRTNSIAALAKGIVTSSEITGDVSAFPVTPAVPPTITPIRPISPNVPIPVGAPNDGF